MTLAAGSTGNSTLDLVGAILQFGLPGLIFLDVAVTRKVFTLQLFLTNEQKERERERAAFEATVTEQKATILRLTNLAEDQVIPALTRATEVNRDYLQMLQAKSQERRYDR